MQRRRCGAFSATTFNVLLRSILTRVQLASLGTRRRSMTAMATACALRLGVVVSLPLLGGVEVASDGNDFGHDIRFFFGEGCGSTAAPATNPTPAPVAPTTVMEMDCAPHVVAHPIPPLWMASKWRRGRALNTPTFPPLAPHVPRLD